MIAVPNRVKFFLAGNVLEFANPLLPGRPHDQTAALAGELPFHRALELCGGTGYGARRIAARHPAAELHSLDISPEMIATGSHWLRRSGLANVSLVEGDAESLPYPDGHFDVVFSTFGLHELPTDVRRGAVREAARVLTTGGRIVVTDLDQPSGPVAKRLCNGYMRIVEPAYARGIFGTGLSNLLAENSFSVTHHRPGGRWSPLQVLVAVRR